MGAPIAERIHRLKKRLATVDGDEFEVTFRELRAAMDEQRDAAAQARREAYRRIADDGAFPAGRYLRILRQRRD